jgi:hypothetical protein
MRQQKSRPLVTALREAKLSRVPGRGQTAEAVCYALNTGRSQAVPQGWTHRTRSQQRRARDASDRSAAEEQPLLWQRRRWRVLDEPRFTDRDLQAKQRQSTDLLHRRLTHLLNGCRAASANWPGIGPRNRPRLAGRRTSRSRSTAATCR